MKVERMTLSIVSACCFQLLWCRKVLPLLLLLPAGLLGTLESHADEIHVTGGRDYQGVTITSATWEQVEYSLQGVTTSQKIAADRVLELVFSLEPVAMGRGRGALEQGDYEGAVDALKNSTNQGDPRHRANAKYLYGLALLRWGEQDPVHLPQAIVALGEFLSEFEQGRDYYVPHARMALSEAQRRSGNWTEAGQALEVLARGDLGKHWILGASLGNAEVLLAQDKWAEAREVFSSVANNSQAGARLSTEAWLGYATCQVGQKQWSSATDTVRQKILETRDRNVVAMTSARARAWLIWGRATQGKSPDDREELQWAMIRYFRASVIATTGDGEILAEALFRAKSAAKALGQTDRVEELTQRLQQLVPNSPWNR